MVDGIVKIAGSLFIGGIGLGLILVCTMVLIVIFKEFKERWDDR